MIQKISCKISAWLFKLGAISADEQELYQYAVYCFLFSSAPLIAMFIIGIFLGMWFESLLFILPFMLIRKFSGGFHLKSPVACFLVSTALLTAFLMVIQYMIEKEIYWLPLIFAFLSVVLLALFSPVDSQQRQLSEKEKTVFKRVAIIISVTIFLLYILFMMCGLERIALPIGIGLILPALLQIPCLFAKLSLIREKE
ncbi:MAG: accessory gene regulator ArgB-like protein [Massiliimalia sp.]|jgi:accessory gene regulator B